VSVVAGSGAVGPQVGEEVVLETRNIVKRFGGIVALNGVNIKLRKGKITLLIGPNGSGKTTLVNVISGFIMPDEGQVIFKGRDITRLPPHERVKLGLIRTFQIPRPFHNLTVLENVLAAAEGNPGENPYIAGISKRAWYSFEEEAAKRAFSILDWVGLLPKWEARASDLSGGQMKLLEIARAIMKGADTIIMDEPAAGVNPKLVHELFDRIVKLSRDKDVTFLIIEHRIGLISKYIDYAYAMNMGEIIAEGRPEEVFNNPLVLESYLGG